MKILITDITGMIGGILAPDLERYHEVHDLDKLPSARPNTTQSSL